MSTDNPYQSPESSSTPEPSDEVVERVNTRFPTWRFWVLVVACIPGFILGEIALYVFYDLSGDALSARLLALLFFAFVIAYLAASGTIFFFWRAPADKDRDTQKGRNRSAVLGALWILAILATPSACAGVCTPIVSLSGNKILIPESQPFSAVVLGGLLGLLAAILVVVFARGLWLDAVGRPISKTDETAVARPIPRLRAKPSIRNRNGSA